MRGEPCLIRSPHAIRPWQFVLEPLRGYLVLAEKLSEDGARFATGWNFGPAEADAKPVSWIADQLSKAWGRGATWILDKAPHPREANFLKLDTSKARAELDWQPVLSIHQSLDWIAEWYRAFDAGSDLRAMTLGQIDRYEQAMEAQVGSEVPPVLLTST